MDKVTSPFLGYKTSSQFFFISYILSDQVWWCNIKRFLSYSENYTCKFMQTNTWHLNYSTFICPSESGKCGRGKGKRKGKNTKIGISREREELFRWNKKHFAVFEGLSLGEKIKNLIKNCGHKL